MTLFDRFYFSIFSFYKERYKQKAKTMALVYISILQISLLFLFGCFCAAFVSRMPNMETMSANSAWTLFILFSIGIYFKNWMQYTGKKRMVIQAKINKHKTKAYNIWILWTLPIVVFGLAYVIFQAI